MSVGYSLHGMLIYLKFIFYGFNSLTYHNYVDLFAIFLDIKQADTPRVSLHQAKIGHFLLNFWKDFWYLLALCTVNKTKHIKAAVEASFYCNQPATITILNNR